MGSVEAIYIAAAGGTPMRAVDVVTAVRGRGLARDRYAERRGAWGGRGACEVTLIAGEVLDEIAVSGGPDLGAGRHRRNLVTRGIPLAELEGRRFRVGAAVLQGGGIRPPCRYLERLLGRDDVRGALAGARGGLCAAVVQDGRIRAGDGIQVLEE